MLRKWLAKSEEGVYSIDSLRSDRVTLWDGVRNYQARNFLREMSVGDEVLIYHSNAKPSGIAGLAKVKKLAYPDPTQFDKKSKYYDPKATKEFPRWFCPDLQFVRKFKRLIPLEELKAHPGLKNLPLVKRGSRLSVFPVDESDFDIIISLVK